MLSTQIRHENKICHGCRNRCETIWVCQKILALHQPASTAVQNLSAVHISHKLKYAIGWNFQVGNLGIFSAHFQYRLMLDYHADVHQQYMCARPALWFACSSIWCTISLNKQPSNWRVVTKTCCYFYLLRASNHIKHYCHCIECLSNIATKVNNTRNKQQNSCSLLSFSNVHIFFS